jgi:Tol biopolymer transport system component
MSLAAGTRLGPYEIGAPLGSGGMGVVYRARDTKLGRDVALKVLPDAFASDLQRLARFQREAEVLASLNHPHIGGIYGLEDSNGIRALVLELVEGPTLADRLAEGRMSVDEALPITRQIAEALQAAHERGIIHRDLKPANIKVTPDGLVKVLDFGLAKPVPSGASGSDAGQSPAVTTPAMTQAGIVLGTAAYMSPEQAKGREADKRSDIWSLGCVLYEMLTGTRAFDGEDMAEVLGAVVRLEPEWGAVPSDVSPAVRTLLHACLVKDRRQRVADMAAVLFVLGNVTSLTATEPGPAQTATPHLANGVKQRWRRTAAIGAAALFIGAGVSGLYFRRPPTPPTPEQSAVRLSLALPADVALAPGVNQLVPVVSPDGRRIAFSASQPGEPIRIWVRSLESLDARSLAGTDNARGPFWSPDSRTLAFFADDKLKTIDAAGGPVQNVCDVPNAGGNPGAAWNRAGTIVFARRTGGLMKVAASGGDPVPATVVDSTNGDGSHVFPAFLGDGRRFLYLSRPSNTLWLGALDSSEVTRLFSPHPQVLYSNSHLLFARQGTLLAQPFDAGRATTTGEPTIVAGQVAIDSTIGAAAFSTSETGVLVYRTGAPGSQTQLTWVDRSGKEIGKVGPVGAYRNPVLSRNGTRVALEALDFENRTQDLYILELAGGNLSRFTFDRGNDIYPVWSPGDGRIAFGSDRQRGIHNLYERMSGGAAEEDMLLLASTASASGSAPFDWSPDGKYLLFRNTSAETRGTANISILPLSGERTPSLLFPPANFNQTHPQVSPDGRWVAYVSRETGQNEVYVASFPTPRGKWPISKGGAAFPRWRGDSRELFYYAADGRITAVAISGTTTLNVGTPVPLFSARILGGPSTIVGFRAQYDVRADGERFLLNVPVDEDASSPAITVVLNWAAGLRR